MPSVIVNLLRRSAYYFCNFFITIFYNASFLFHVFFNRFSSFYLFRGYYYCNQTDFLPIEEWHLPPGPKPRIIRSIHIAEEDDHVFLADRENRSIIELRECGQILIEFRFDDINNEKDVYFEPLDMCSISPDILVVCGQGKCGRVGKIFFLERKKVYPFLKIKKLITSEKIFFSLCSKNESIFCCDFFLEIHCFTKEGEKVKTVKIDKLTTGSLCSSLSRIRVDSLTGNFWASSLYDRVKLVYFNSDGEKLDSVDKREIFLDFAINKFGHLYFATEEGTFSLFPEKRLLYTFPKQAEKYFPKISVSEDKILVCVKNDGKDMILLYFIENKFCKF